MSVNLAQANENPDIQTEEQKTLQQAQAWRGDRDHEQNRAGSQSNLD